MAQIPRCQFAPGQITQSQPDLSQIPQSECGPAQITQAQRAPGGLHLKPQLAPDGQNLQDNLATGPITQTPFAPGSIPQGHFVPRGQFPSQFGPVQQIQQDYIPQSQYFGTTPRGQFSADTYGSGRGYYVPGQLPQGEMSLKLHAMLSPEALGQLFSRGPNLPGQYIPLSPDHFAADQIPPSQLLSGRIMPPRQTMLGGLIAPRVSFSRGNQYTSAKLLQDHLSAEDKGYQQAAPSGPQYTSTQLPRDQFGPEGTNWKELGFQQAAPPGQFLLGGETEPYAQRDQDSYNILSPCGSEGNIRSINISPSNSTESSLCNCVDLTCTCTILDGRDRCRNKERFPNHHQDANVQSSRTGCYQSLIVNTSLKLDHSKTVPGTETFEVSDKQSDISKSNAGCECRYPPQFCKFHCTGNVCGTCNCHEKPNE